MAKELNEDTTFKMSIKTMGMIAAGIAVVVAGWYSLMQEIQEAKEQPVPVDVTIIKEEILHITYHIHDNSRYISWANSSNTL